jgi:PKD repeat protein
MTNDLCSSDTLCEFIEVDCPPVSAGYSFTQSSDTVHFTDTSLNAIQWFWSFGDDSVSAEQNPMHIYVDTGMYIVCLTAYDSCSSDMVCDTVTIYPVNVNQIRNDGDEFEIYPNPASDALNISLRIRELSAIEITLENAEGKTTLNETWSFDAPRANPPSRNPFGTLRNASSLNEVTSGRIIIPITMPGESALKPESVGIIFCNNGVTVTNGNDQIMLCTSGTKDENALAVRFDPDSGAIAIGDYVRVGQTVQFHVRDAATADEDLHALLQMDLSAHEARMAMNG